eukprot:6189996-Pleurochrysis_carterae.AAC.1
MAADGLFWSSKNVDQLWEIDFGRTFPIGINNLFTTVQRSICSRSCAFDCQNGFAGGWLAKRPDT